APEKPRASRFDAIEPSPTPTRSPEVSTDNEIFSPPFLGSRVVKGVSVDDIVPFLNLTALFRNQWQFRPELDENDREFKERVGLILRGELAKVRTDDLLLPQVVYGYYPANGDGNELVIWSDEQRSSELARFGFPRQP